MNGNLVIMFLVIYYGDGTDNNYVEFVLKWTNTTTYRIGFSLRRRVDGGVVSVGANYPFSYADFAAIFLVMSS